VRELGVLRKTGTGDLKEVFLYCFQVLQQRFIFPAVVACGQEQSEATEFIYSISVFSMCTDKTRMFTDIGLVPKTVNANIYLDEIKQ